MRALKVLETFLVEHPNDPRVPQVKVMLRKVHTLLGEHELYVARYYLSRDKPRAALARLEDIERKYPHSKALPETKRLIASIYAEHKIRKR